MLEQIGAGALHDTVLIIGVGTAAGGQPEQRGSQHHPRQNRPSLQYRHKNISPVSIVYKPNYTLFFAFRQSDLSDMALKFRKNELM
ncbi:MAG TPA: hypothetical protein DD673_11640 [Lentisphaeria bacterium]|nr:hypothetical protein [Lentisphaeria bacterium]